MHFDIPDAWQAETLSSALRINRDGTHASAEHDADSPEREALCQIETKVLFKQGQGEAAQQQASMCKSEGLKSEAEKMKTLSNEQMFSRFSIIDKVNLGEGRSSWRSFDETLLFALRCVCQCVHAFY